MKIKLKCIFEVFIINYNVLGHLKSCIKSIYNSDINSEFEIIIIDNNSPEPIDIFSDSDNLKIIQFFLKLKKEYYYLFILLKFNYFN